MKRLTRIILVNIAVIGIVVACCRCYAERKANEYMQPLVVRGWHVHHSRPYICGVLFVYWRDDNSNCFPPFVSVTWFGRIIQEQSF